MWAAYVLGSLGSVWALRINAHFDKPAISPDLPISREELDHPQRIELPVRSIIGWVEERITRTHIHILGIDENYNTIGQISRQEISLASTTSKQEK
jgi:hypothetical protein